MMVNRYQVGRDGRTAYRRTVGKECVQKVVEFGEQVHVKPKRRPQTNRKQSLDSKEIAELAAGETPVVYADVEGDGTQIPEDDHISEDKTVRDFKITRQVLQKDGYSDHCVGCDAALYGRKRGHTTMCRKRLEEAMKADEVDQRRIRRRNERMTGKSHRIDQHNGDDVQMKDEKLDEAKKETGR